MLWRFGILGVLNVLSPVFSISELPGDSTVRFGDRHYWPPRFYWLGSNAMLTRRGTQDWNNHKELAFLAPVQRLVGRRCCQPPAFEVPTINPTNSEEHR